MKYRIGIDLGGTKLAVGVVDPAGTVVSQAVTYDHRDADGEGLIDCMERNIDDALSHLGVERNRVETVGVLFPGHIRWPDGVALTSSNLNIGKDFRLKELLQDRIRIPVVADNDANGQTLAEHRFGAGRGSRHMVFLTVSTGIGGGIIIDGKLYRGATGTAGEFGHMIVEASGRISCTCGNKGCLMSMASGIALPLAVRRVANLLSDRGGPVVLPDGCVDFDHLDGIMLAGGVRERNDLCNQIISDFATYVGIALYNIFQILNPERVVLGGGLLNLPDIFFDAIKSACYGRARGMMYDAMEIRKGELGGAAGIVGAAFLDGEC